MKFKLHQLVASSAAGLAFVQTLHAATVVTFEGVDSIGGSGNTAIGASTFADFVSATGPGVEATMGVEFVGTPNLDIDWTVAGLTDYYPAWNGRTNVAQLDYTRTGAANPIQWNIVPDSPTIAVIVNSFDLDMWAGGGNAQIDWSIEGSVSGPLASGTWTRSTGGRDTISPNITGVAGESLTLTFQHVSGLGNYLALDNLSFDQVTIPEPSGVTLAVAGLGALALRRRRK